MLGSNVLLAVRGKIDLRIIRNRPEGSSMGGRFLPYEITPGRRDPASSRRISMARITALTRKAGRRAEGPLEKRAQVGRGGDAFEQVPAFRGTGMRRIRRWADYDGATAWITVNGVPDRATLRGSGVHQLCAAALMIPN